MKTYYSVITSYYDNGRVTSNLIDTIQAEKKPESTYKSTKKCDIYTDWFKTKKEAQKHIKEALSC